MAPANTQPHQAVVATVQLLLNHQLKSRQLKSQLLHHRRPKNQLWQKLRQLLQPNHQPKRQ
jgi:hypothetical protein